MIDREKVIKALEVCIPLDEGENCPTECPYYRDVCYGYSQVMRDALTLLKEQEAVEPDTDSEGTCSCGNCGETVGYFPAGCSTPLKFYKFCQMCGMPVKWE